MWDTFSIWAPLRGHFLSFWHCFRFKNKILCNTRSDVSQCKNPNESEAGFIQKLLTCPSRWAKHRFFPSAIEWPQNTPNWVTKAEEFFKALHCQNDKNKHDISTLFCCTGGTKWIPWKCLKVQFIFTKSYLSFSELTETKQVRYRWLHFHKAPTRNRLNVVWSAQRVRIWIWKVWDRFLYGFQKNPTAVSRNVNFRVQLKIWNVWDFVLYGFPKDPTAISRNFNFRVQLKIWNVWDRFLYGFRKNSTAISRQFNFRVQLRIRLSTKNFSWISFVTET